MLESITFKQSRTGPIAHRVRRHRHWFITLTRSRISKKEFDVGLVVCIAYNSFGLLGRL